MKIELTPEQITELVERAIFIFDCVNHDEIKIYLKDFICNEIKSLTEQQFDEVFKDEIF